MKFALFMLSCILILGTVSALSAKEKSAANFAVTEMGPGYSLRKIQSVETQVVRGTMYHIKAKVKYQIPGGVSRTLQCFFKVWERPHGYRTVEESNCN